MQKKLRTLVDEVTYEDLYKMKADLDSGGIHLKKLIDGKIAQVENENIKVCATCRDLAKGWNDPILLPVFFAEGPGNALNGSAVTMRSNRINYRP